MLDSRSATSHHRTAATALVVSFLVVTLSAQSSSMKHVMEQDPACQSLMPASVGGPMPIGQDTLVVRWLGWTNYELTYRGNVFLLDSYYDRGPRYYPIGVAAKDFKKVTAIFIGHAHSDHISEAPTVAKQTGAPIYGASFAADYLMQNGVPAKQFKEVKGGEVMTYQGVTVETILGHHNIIAQQLPPGHLDKQHDALEKTLLVPFTDEETKEFETIQKRGSRDPGIADRGVINYMFTFGNNFHLVFVDSPGPITDGQRAVIAKVPSVDVAMLPYIEFDAGVPPLVELVKAFKPSVVYLGHHDGPSVALWSANYPAALAIRDASPKTRTMEVLYRTPVCFNTTTKEMIGAW